MENIFVKPVDMGKVLAFVKQSLTDKAMLSEGENISIDPIAVYANEHGEVWLNQDCYFKRIEKTIPFPIYVCREDEIAISPKYQFHLLLNEDDFLPATPIVEFMSGQFNYNTRIIDNQRRFMDFAEKGEWHLKYPIVITNHVNYPDRVTA